MQSAYVRPGQNNLVSDEADTAKNYYIVIKSDSGFSCKQRLGKVLPAECDPVRDMGYLLGGRRSDFSASRTPG